MSIEAPPLERKLIAILAADVEGYSRLMHDDEEATLAALSANRAIIDELIVGAGGKLRVRQGTASLRSSAAWWRR